MSMWSWFRSGRSYLSFRSCVGRSPSPLLLYQSCKWCRLGPRWWTPWHCRCILASRLTSLAVVTRLMRQPI
jgi:hypothetical protein